MSADRLGDKAIKLQGLDHFSFSLADARRDPLTGEFAEDEDIEDVYRGTGRCHCSRQ